MYLFEILVPTIYGDTKKPIRTRHHKNWDAGVRKLAGGLTLLQPVIGEWVGEVEVERERVIPVRVACLPTVMRRVVAFTMKHYEVSQNAKIIHSTTSKCPHPARSGKHEIYLRGAGGGYFCRACGAELA